MHVTTEIVQGLFYADVTQLVEKLICNQPVVGSSPSIGSKWYVSSVG